MENTNLKKLNLLVDERGFQQIANMLEGGRNQTNIYSFSYSETEMKANVIKETNFLCYCDYARRSVEGTLVYLIQNKKEKFSYLDNPNIKFLDKYDKPNLNAAYRRCNLRLLIDNTKFNNLCVKENFNSLYINYRDISILNQVFKLNIISKVFEDDTFKVYCCSLKNFASKEELNTSIKNLFRIIPEERIETDGKSIVVSNRAKFAKDILEKACFYSDTNLDVCLDKTVAKEVHAEFVKDCITEKKDVSSVLFVFYYNYFIKNRLECGVNEERLYFKSLFDKTIKELIEKHPSVTAKSIMDAVYDTSRTIVNLSNYLSLKEKLDLVDNLIDFYRLINLIDDDIRDMYYNKIKKYDFDKNYIFDKLDKETEGYENETKRINVLNAVNSFLSIKADCLINLLSYTHRINDYVYKGSNNSAHNLRLKGMFNENVVSLGTEEARTVLFEDFCVKLLEKNIDLTPSIPTLNSVFNCSVSRLSYIAYKYLVNNYIDHLVRDCKDSKRKKQLVEILIDNECLESSKLVLDRVQTRSAISSYKLEHCKTLDIVKDETDKTILLAIKTYTMKKTIKD